jgi:glycosyltransferase involved in cell wall biosynthesis
MAWPWPPPDESRCCIYLPCYNAERFLEPTIARIPWPLLAPDLSYEVLMVDNASRDATRAAIARVQTALESAGTPVRVILHESNRGYGGTVKSAMRHCLEQGIGWMVVLHSDGQYAPEQLPRLLAELRGDPSRAVHFGSRLTDRPLKGGMPIYKYAANRVLTAMQNLALRQRLSEYHSGYRLYRMRLAGQVRFEDNSGGFVFDNEILFQLADAGFGIGESPIPTHYGEEKSHVPVLSTPLRIIGCTAAYLLHKTGLRRQRRYLPR